MRVLYVGSRRDESDGARLQVSRLAPLAQIDTIIGPDEFPPSLDGHRYDFVFVDAALLLGGSAALLSGLTKAAALGVPTLVVGGTDGLATLAGLLRRGVSEVLLDGDGTRLGTLLDGLPAAVSLHAPDGATLEANVPASR
jgi:hypothetical protein